MRTFKIIHESEWPPSADIAALRLVKISLALKRYVVVGSHHVAIIHEPQEPFNPIPKVEAYDEEFDDLTRVDVFVVHFTSIECRPGEYDSK